MPRQKKKNKPKANAKKKIIPSPQPHDVENVTLEKTDDTHPRPCSNASQSRPEEPSEKEATVSAVEEEEPSCVPRSCIEHRWNGPRVLDVDAFLESSYAAAPALDAEDTGRGDDGSAACAMYARPGVREMLVGVLPKETALILWYNKTRKSARICPACRRFYAVRDILFPHLLDDQTRSEYVDPRNLREKQISGLCSLMCFGIASYNWPGSIGAWGKLASEIDATTQAILHSPGANIADDGMGVLMKLSRLDSENLLGTVKMVHAAGRRLY